MKDPAFLFYSADFLTGTYLMSDEQVGKYIRLICLQHQKGRIKPKEFSKIVNGDEDLIEKFTIDQEGNYFNERLEDEVIRRMRFTDSRRKNAKGKQKAYAEHMHKHMENENENINESKNEVKGVVRGKCLMKNSGVTLEDIKSDFAQRDDLKNANAKHYYQAVMDWSDAKGEMRKDWIATARTFARRDIEDGKLKIVSSVKHHTNKA